MAVTGSLWGHTTEGIHIHPSTYNPHLVDLSDHGIHHFSFEWAEYNGLVFDWVEDKPSPWLDYTCPNVVNGGDCDDKTIP